MNDTRKQHWERVYQERDPLQVSWYQPRPAISLQLIDNCGLPSDAPLIDIGGGASTLVDHLLDAGFADVSVLDIADSALKHAARRLGDRANRVHWLCCDATQVELDQPVALWHDRAVFHFLTDPADQQAYVGGLRKHLQPGGFAIIAAFAIGGPSQCSGLDIVQYDANKLLDVLGDGFELIEQVDELHQTPAGKQQAFGYYRLQRD